nr:MAG TPA: hypothetical protein [Bacteriophage sp.]
MRLVSGRNLFPVYRCGLLNTVCCFDVNDKQDLCIDNDFCWILADVFLCFCS